MPFNPQEYFNANPDLAAAGLTVNNAADHYAKYGQFENRPGTGVVAASGGLGTTTPSGVSQSDFNTWQQQVTQAFDNTNANLGSVGANLASNIGSAVSGISSGINSNMKAGFKTTNDNMKTGFDATNQNLIGGFDATNQNLGLVNENITTGFDGVNAGFQTVNDNMTANQATNAGYFDNMNNQIAGLGTNINQIGGNLDTYYGDLSNNQQTLLNTTDGISTGMDDFRQEYNQRTNVADMKRGELIDSVAGNANQLKSAITAISPGQGQPQGQQGYGTGQQGYPQGQAPQGQPQGQQQPAPIVNTISRARDVLASTPNLNPNVGNQLSEFINSFDQQGQFLNQGLDAMGVPTIRNLSANGQIAIAKQNAQGQYVTSGVISVPQIESLLGAVSSPQGLGSY